MTITGNADVDHIIPWRLVREDKIWNFVLACKKCNSKKSDKVPERIVMYKVLERNEKIANVTNEIVSFDMKGYSADTMMRLWNYAKIGGYKEYYI